MTEKVPSVAANETKNQKTSTSRKVNNRRQPNPYSVRDNARRSRVRTKADRHNSDAPSEGSIANPALPEKAPKEHVMLFTQASEGVEV